MNREVLSSVMCFQSGLTAREDLQFTDATPDGILQTFFFAVLFGTSVTIFCGLTTGVCMRVCACVCACVCVCMCVVHIQHTFWEWITTTFEAFK